MTALTPSVPAPRARASGAARTWGAMRRHALLVYALLAFGYLLLPIAVVVAFSFNDPRGRFNYVWQGFTVEHWRRWDAVPGLSESLWSSLQIAAGRFKGALGEEMRLTLQEQRMGVELAESLTNLRERIDSPNLKSFVRSVVQGERLGVSIGNVMRDLSIDMRKRRRQSAEEQAQKTPVKMLIPLVFLILPSLFIVVLAPPMIGFLDSF